MLPRRVRRVAPILICCCILILLVFNQKRSRYRYFNSSDDNIEGAPGQCVRSQMTLWHPEIKKLFHEPAPLRCDEVQNNWLYIDHGRIRISSNITRELMKVNLTLNQNIGEPIICKCQPVIRQAQSDIILGDPVQPCSEGMDVPADAFDVKCISKLGGVYKNLHLSIKRNEKAIHRAKKARYKLPAESMNLNILMFGFDTVSRLNWLRNLPKSYKYFTDVLGGITLEGYNIIGDGTPQALLPILTGMTEEELPEARKGYPGAASVDGHPWIWKHLHHVGYVSQFGEDDAVAGTWEMRMNGFEQQPVDHYYRPYQYLLHNSYSTYSPPHCVGSRSRLDVMLNWIEQFYGMYPDANKFTFLFHNDYSHDSFSQLSLADDTLEMFLRNMYNSGYLNNTLLVLMSDHGARFQKFRESQQGKYEERLPYFGLRLPSWFGKTYPEALANLKNNAKLITSPFDIHETFKDVVRYVDKGVIHNPDRGISLFQAIPNNRTCHQAHIEPHWCACLDWVNLTVHDHGVVSAVKQTMLTINQMLENQTQCETIEVFSIISAMLFSPKRDLLQFKGSRDPHGREADLTGKMQASEEFYQVTILAKPNGAIYETTVTHTMTHGSNYHVDAKSISRLNAYGNQPHCIEQSRPSLRAYCYCKIQLPDT